MAAELIREVSHEARSSICSIRTDTYNHTFGHINKLVDAAYEDFPSLGHFEIDVVVYGGSYIKRIWGIEFRAPADSVPDNYRTAIGGLENHL